MKRRTASSRWDLLRTTVRAKSVSRGDLGVGGAGGYTFASFVNDANAAAREDEEEGQLGATNQSSTCNRHMRRVLKTLSDHCDERTLKALSETVPDLVREALGRRGTEETGGGSKSIMVRNPSFRRQSRAARRRIELEVLGTAEGDTVADTSLHAVGTTTGERKGSDVDNVTLDGIVARNQEFFQHQKKENERVDAEEVQEKPDLQYDNPMQQQQRVVAAVDTCSYDVFDTGAERTAPPGDGKDTQYGNPMMQPARQEAEERGSKNLMIREQTRMYNAEGGRGQGGGARGEVQPFGIDAVARSTSIALE
jgi:hypothetical protein